MKPGAVIGLGSLRYSLVFSILIVVLLAAAPEAKKQHRVPRIEGRISVDAVLDELAWDSALKLELAYEVQPGENVKPPVRTEVLLAYSKTHLYAAFRAYDDDPSQIRARLSDRDALYNDDWVALVIDTFNDERRMFEFFVNPLGVQGDLIECNECSGDSYDAIWASAGRITSWGYAVEVAIPFSSMRFQRESADQTWNFDAVRNYPRTVEHRIGLFPRDRSNNCYLCQADEIVGFAGATPGRNIEIVPTFSSLYSEERENFTDGDFRERDKLHEPGITARWGFTPNMTLQATLNPDFSQVEADAAQLDINTNFALFYPERRPFFTEGVEFFGTSLNAVHSRTLADPSWGIKLTGKEGANAVGFYTVRDEITNLLFPGSAGSSSTTLDQQNTSTVLRYRRDIFESSTIGVLATDREGQGYFNRVVGIDGILVPTRTDQVRFQAAGSVTDYPDSIAAQFGQPQGDFDGGAIDVLYTHASEAWDWFCWYREAGKKFRADQGFLPKTNIRHTEFGGGRTWQRDASGWYTLIRTGPSFEYDEEINGTRIWRLANAWLDYQGPHQSELHLFAHVYAELYYKGKKFDYRRCHISGGIRPTGTLRLGLNGMFGESIDYDNVRQGYALRLSPSLEYKLGRRATIEYDHTWERMNLESGKRLYTADIGRLRLVYQFTRRVFVRTIIQYVRYRRVADLYIDAVEPETNHLFSQLLFSYKINPQTVLYLGFSDNHHGPGELDIIQTDRTFFAKVGYAWVL